MIEDLAHDALAGIADHAARDDAPENVMQVWKAIDDDLRSRGPFSALLRSFREGAVAAVTDLAFAPADDTKRIASLQAEIRRYLTTMEIIAGFKDRAGAFDADMDQVTTHADEDDDFIPNLED